MTQSADEEMLVRAQQYAREHRKRIVSEVIAGFSADEKPASIFMAGSPGAGKTEASRRLLENAGRILRIDADELRDHFIECGYRGDNSHLFQKAVTGLVHDVHNAALKKRISFLLDGTFSNENIARQNIQRSLKRNRDVFIFFVYQPPMTAWSFVQEREFIEGRRVHLEVFANKFGASREVANKMKAEFGNNITLTLIRKDIVSTDKFAAETIENIKSIDNHIEEKYTEAQILNEIQQSRC